MGIPTLISTATASGATSVDIESGVDGTYDEYMFVCTDMGPATDGKDFFCKFSVDGGSNYGLTKTTTIFRGYHKEDDSAATLAYEGGQDLAQSTNALPLAPAVGNGADESCATILHLFSPSSTTYVKHFYYRTCTYAHIDAVRDVHGAGYINNTSAVNAVQFYFQDGVAFDGVIQMYGIS